VRFAWAANDGTLTGRRSYSVASFETFSDALKAYFAESGWPAACAGVAIGAAGPVDDGQVKLTNAPWTIRISEILAVLSAPVVLINDLEAAAYALPALLEDDLQLIGEPKPDLRRARKLLAVNVGTGFNAAALIRTDSDWISCSSEAGHMTLDTARLAPYNAARKFTRVEHILSGRGVPVLYNAVANTSKTLQPAEVFALAKTDEHAAETLRLFTQIFASTVGDLVLAVGAWDGAFIFGSVAKGFAGVADLALFRQELEDKGPMRDRMKRLPVALVLKEDAALTGLARVRLPA
jgi:glucokinase